MTVHELIAQLEKLPQDARVLINAGVYIDDDDWHEVNGASMDAFDNDPSGFCEIYFEDQSIDEE